MAVYSQLPGALSPAFRRGDAFSAALDFNPTSFVGVDVTANLLSVVTGNSVQPLTVAVTDAAAGKVTVSLTASQSSSLAAGTYRWELIAGQRTYLTGFVEVT